MFIIVSTFESGSEVFSCVPEGWVQDNCLLFWPPEGSTDKKIYKLRSKEVCPKENWRTFQCKKRSEGPFQSFIDGIQAEKSIVGFTDTESELQ